MSTAMDASPEKAAIIVKAACTLHNLLCTISDSCYIPAGYADQPLPNGEIINGFWRLENNLAGLQAIPRGHALAATRVRNRYAHWFSEEGATDWQDTFLNRIN